MRSSVEISDDRLVHFQARVIQDAIAEATASYWERRAELLEATRPRRGDYIGGSTPAELTARWQRLTEQAQACRNRAAVERMRDDHDHQVALVLAEHAAAIAHHARRAGSGDGSAAA